MALIANPGPDAERACLHVMQADPENSDEHVEQHELSWAEGFDSHRPAVSGRWGFAQAFFALNVVAEHLLGFHLFVQQWDYLRWLCRG